MGLGTLRNCFSSELEWQGLKRGYLCIYDGIRQVVTLNTLIGVRAFCLEPFAINLTLIWKRSFARVDNDVGLVWLKW